MKNISRYNFFFTVFIIFITFIFCLLNHKKGHNWGGDFSLYIRQASSVLNGTIENLVKSNSFTVQESSDHTFSPVTYPWGFPSLLTPVYYFSGLNYSVLKIYESIFFIGFLTVFFFSIRRKFNWIYTLCTITLVGFNYNYISYTNRVLSEFPFMFFSFLTLHFIKKLEVESKTNLGVQLPVAIGLLIFFSFYIRTEGIVLLFTLFIAQAANLKGNLKVDLFNIKQCLKLIIPYLIFLACYILSKAVFPTGFTSHFGYRNLVNLDRTITNVIFYKNQLARSVYPNLPEWFFWATIIFFLRGVVFRFRTDKAFLVFLASIVTVFLVWPFHESRYLFTIYPIFIYFVLQGLRTFRRRSALRWIVASIIFVYLGLTINQTFQATIDSFRNRADVIDGPESGPSQEMFRFIRNRTSPSDVIIFFKPRVMNLYTQRNSLMVYNDIENVRRKGNYLVIYSKAGKVCQLFLSPKEMSLNSNFKSIFKNNDFTVYKILN
ncbi:hypothetical protein OC25_17510 [Pedobacter kyungheensis]|uniref:Glycosyltransferase RgtA/B/C/D-like domain-containing protein n=1 Tax=Pedobacter kyungheensis TaxID=1069985 RepID=A0A0C1D5E4_9SPHI|nr:hypothetical protein [Pedobacter kyungheensis]KIA92236.1 hypothetical protein OC25_17510 [Pedobacter kyungheensis]